MSITIGSNLYQLIEIKKLSSNWWPHIPQPLPLVLFSLVKLRFMKERPMLLHSLSPLPRSSTEKIRKQGHQKTCCHCPWTPSTWPLISHYCLFTYTQKPTRHLVSMTTHPSDSHVTSGEPPFPSNFQVFHSLSVPQCVALSDLLYDCSWQRSHHFQGDS